MILPNDIKPDKSLYAIGSSIISVLSVEQFGVIDSNILYNKFSDNYSEKISFSYFLYALDWLYLLGLINITEKVEIKKCF